MSSLPSAPTRVPFWRDVRVLRWAFQLVVLALVFALLFWLYGNYQANVAKSSIPTNLRFLDNPSNFTIPGNDLDQSAPVRDAFYQGFLNTLQVAIAGIVFATILGTLVGIARLSKNFLVRTIAAAYVEVIRNIPLLLLLTFMNLAVVLQTFPRIEEAWLPLDLFVISNRGIAIPWFVGSTPILLAVGAAAILAAWATGKIRARISDATGKPARAGLYAFAVFALITLSGWVALGYTVTLPFVDDRATDGGFRSRPLVLRLVGNPGDLHQQPYCGNRPWIHHGCPPRSGRSSRRSCSEARGQDALGDPPPGVPDCHARRGKPVPQPHQELIPGCHH